MKFMNDDDIYRAINMHAADTVAGRAARFLDAFRQEVDNHSDGWAYWMAPVKAAERLMVLIEAGRDATESEFRAALKPIKAFYNRKGNAAGMTFPEVR